MRVARAAGAGAAVVGILRERVAPLDHEVRDDAVEARAVVELASWRASRSSATVSGASSSNSSSDDGALGGLDGRGLGHGSGGLGRGTEVVRARTRRTWAAGRCRCAGRGRSAGARAVPSRRCGNSAIRSRSIFSGSVVPREPEQPRDSRPTWVSTVTPSLIPKALPRMTLAVFRPTPGSTLSSLHGSRESRRRAARPPHCAMPMRLFVLLRKKPVDRMISSTSAGRRGRSASASG